MGRLQVHLNNGQGLSILEQICVQKSNRSDFSNSGLAAIPAAAAAGASYDIVATAATGEAQGCIAAYEQAAKNPSAGTIFDAVAVPVGDGLAGYSGAKLGKQIGNRMELRGLQKTMKAKYTELESLRGKIPDGELVSKANEISAINSRIRVIKYGKPQHSTDPKSGKVTVSRGSRPNTAAVPVTRYVDSDDKEEQRKNVQTVDEV